MPQGIIRELQDNHTRITLEGRITKISEVRFDHTISLERTPVIFSYYENRRRKVSAFDFFGTIHADVIGERFRLKEYYRDGHNHPHKQELLVRTVRTYRSEMTPSTASTSVLFKDP